MAAIQLNGREGNGKRAGYDVISNPEPLPNPQRVITDTDLETGVSYFNTTLDESLAVKQDLNGFLFCLGYVTDKAPNMLDGTDLTNYIDYLENDSVPPVILPDGRGMMWYIDTPPGKGSPSHRTVSFDIVIQVAGEVEVTLESGEKRIQKPGDMLIHALPLTLGETPARTSGHAWLASCTRVTLLFSRTAPNLVLLDFSRLIGNGMEDLAPT